MATAHHPTKPVNHSKKSTTVIPDLNDPNQSLTLETDPTPTVAPAATPAPVASEPAPTPTDPVEQLHQTIIAQATANAQSGNPQNVDSFVATQWACIKRSLGPNNENLTYFSTFIAAVPNADGTHSFNYFDGMGTCRVFKAAI